MLRAAFWLLAAVVAVELIATLTALIGCAWLILILRAEPIGACAKIGDQVREIWSEVLSAILALLLAARNGNGGSPPSPPSKGP
jgi:Flp pilus assembly pilin Flp